MRTIAAVMIVFCTLVGLAADAAPEIWVKNRHVDLTIYGAPKDGSRRTRSWSDAVGERVAAEGLAWGVTEKGLGQRVLLDSGHIYVDGPQLPQGYLVRVVGKLERRRMLAAPRYAQGYGSDFDYYCIKAETIQRLEQVKSPVLADANAPSK